MKVAAGAAVAGLAGYGIAEFVEHEHEQSERLDDLERENQALQRQQDEMERERKYKHIYKRCWERG